MAYPFRFYVRSVIFLTLVILSGCSFMERRVAEDCKNRAFIGQNLHDYISSRFNSGSQARMAIIPFSAPANLSPQLGLELAQKVHQEILPTGEVPIVEVFNRQDWPGKHEEFYSGNFGAIAFGREAGYDLILVGDILPQRRSDMLEVAIKIIEVDSGITIYYTQSAITTLRDDRDSVLDSVWLAKRTPSTNYGWALLNEAARCIVRGIKRAEG